MSPAPTIQWDGDYVIGQLTGFVIRQTAPRKAHLNTQSQQQPSTFMETIRELVMYQPRSQVKQVLSDGFPGGLGHHRIDEQIFGGSSFVDDAALSKIPAVWPQLVSCIIITFLC
jgi:hypothetical protein